jgi:DNA-binding LacI/PurR family transcriptional regulator
VTFQLDNDGHCGLIERKRLKSDCFEIPKRRIEGYFDILDRTGVSVKIWESSQSNEEGGKRAAEYLFKEENRPTAILATSDRLAIGVIEAARNHPLRIPEDLAVVGFDDIPAARLIAPQLTTVQQPMAEKGRMAVTSLLNEKRRLRLILPATLLIRQSTVAKDGTVA